MTVFFTADTHFGDHRTINIQRRPFATTSEMDAAMIARWNAVVGVDDVVWHLGDVARRAADVPALLDRLHGTKHLLRGNNDPDDTAAAAGWASVGDYAELDTEEHRLILCHYPFRSWNGLWPEGEAALTDEQIQRTLGADVYVGSLGNAVEEVLALARPEAEPLAA